MSSGINGVKDSSSDCRASPAVLYRVLVTNISVSNGKFITEMGYKVKPTDDVRFDVQRLNPIKKEYVLLNKPKDFVTTNKDERGRRTVSSLVSGAPKSELSPVDKLDKSTTGLLLFTNDRELSKRLEKPKKGLCISCNTY